MAGDFSEGGAPFEVAVGEVVFFVEGAELVVVFFVKFVLPGLGVFVAEVEAAAEGAGDLESIDIIVFSNQRIGN